jgi:hypothetical protein
MKCALEPRENLSCATADFAEGLGTNVLFFQYASAQRIGTFCRPRSKLQNVNWVQTPLQNMSKTD